MSDFLFKWRAAFCSQHGPGDPMTRLALHTLGTHMDRDGGNCFPSVKTIAVESGLSERSVYSHLKRAVFEGWIIKGTKGLSGQGWRRNEYTPKIPKKVLNELQDLEIEGTEPNAAPCPKGTAAGAGKVLQEVQTSSPINSSKNKTASFHTFYEAYPLKKGKQHAEKAFFKLLKTNRLPEIPILLQALTDQAKEREALKAQGRFCPEWKHPATWLNGGCWEDETSIPPEPKKVYLT